MKKEKHGVIIAILLFLLIAGIFGTTMAFKKIFSKEENEVKVENKFIYIDAEGPDWPIGEWRIASSASAVTDNVEVDGSEITYAPDGENASVKLTISGELYAESLAEDIAAGDLVYEMPRGLFADQDYNEFLVNDGVAEFYNSSNKLMYTITTGADFPYCNPASSTCESTSYDYYWYIAAGKVNIVNAHDITVESVQDNDYSFSITLRYNYKPECSFGYDSKSYKLMVYISDYDYIVRTYSTTVTGGGTVSLDDIYGGDPTIYEDWQSNWGTEVEQYDFYVQYPVYGWLEGGNDYTLYVDAINMNGILVAYSNDGVNYKLGSSYDYRIDSDNCYVYGSGYADVYCSFIVGYNLNGETAMEAKYRVSVGYSTDADYFEKEINYSVQYGEENHDPTEVEYPEGFVKEITSKNINPNVFDGGVNRLKDSEITYKYLVESGTGSINKTTNGTVKAFNLWNLTEEGTEDYTVSIYSPIFNLDSTYNTDTDPQPLTGDDYYIRSVYLQDDLEYDYVLNAAETEYILELNTDYSTYGDKKLYVRINGGEYQLIGTYKKTAEGVISYVASNSLTTSNDNVTVNTPIALPANVTEVKAEYTGKRAAVYMGTVLMNSLRSSASLNNKIAAIADSGDVIVLKTDANLEVNGAFEKSTRVNAYITKVNVSSTIGAIGSKIGKTEINNVIYDQVKYSYSFYESVIYTTSPEEVSRFLNSQDGATFYLLIPLGAELKEGLTVYKYGSYVTVNTTLSYTENFEGTGRTLVTVVIDDNIENNFYDSGSTLNSGFRIDYTVLYSARSNQDYGTTLNNDVAYFSDIALDDGFVTASDCPVMYFSSAAVQTALDKLFTSNTERRALFQKYTVQVDPISITVGTYTKEVKNALETSYSSSTSVVESNTYNYKLQYSFSAETEEITDVLFVDKLESIDENTSTFRGYYKDIDVSYLDTNGVNLTTYYSTDENVDIDNIDLSLWSTSRPSNLKSITAVAVSCGTHVFKGSENVVPSITINMTAPNGYTEAGMKAYNKSYISFTQVGLGSNKKITSAATEVELKKANISVTGTTSAGTGTQTDPATVNDDYSYSFVVKNNDSSNTFENVVLTVWLPEGLTLANNTDPNLTYYSGNRRINYTISSLAPGASMNISFDTEIVFDDIPDDAVFYVDYYISYINGNEYNGDRQELYNRLELPTLEFNKYANTSDTNGFSDEAVILITKGETYKYRISVKNTSDVNATDILVYDNVPEGLTVSNVNNSGTYDGSSHKVTWNVATLAAGQTVNLEYDVKVPDSINLGTKYRSSGHVTLTNPLSLSNYLYDVDTNIVSTLYQLASDVKVANTLAGALADTDKVFNYEATFEGSSEDVGIYDVNDANGDKIGELSIDNNGNGTYNFTLKGSEAVEFKLLPGGINYVIKQQKEQGYETIISNSTDSNGYISISGVTNEERKVTYTFKNTYNVSTSVNLKAKVKYDQGLEAEMFKVKIYGNAISYEIDNNDTGVVNFPAIDYADKVGQFTYNIEQVDTNIPKVVYDTSKFKAVVNLENDGQGNLSATVKYYDANNEEVDEIEFVNTYQPNGMVIQSINNSDYIDDSKVFSYTLTLSSNEVPSASYKVLNANKEEIGTIDLVDGSGSFTFELKSNESISIVDVPENINYVISQSLIDYYTSSVVGASYTINEDSRTITTEGVTVDGNIQVKFNNNYVTSGSFSPSVKVELEGKDLEGEEFVFMITDVSDGITNGYTLTKRNNEDGEVLFNDIEYTRPGTYKYEIVQLSTNSNHIYYDNNKILLTVTLTDNGDNTMDVLGIYEYFNDEESFINRYSEEPIVKEEEKEVIPKNPNTLDRTILVFVLLLIATALFIIERRVRRRRYELRA